MYVVKRCRVLAAFLCTYVGLVSVSNVGRKNVVASFLRSWCEDGGSNEQRETGANVTGSGRTQAFILRIRSQRGVCGGPRGFDYKVLDYTCPIIIIIIIVLLFMLLFFFCFLFFLYFLLLLFLLLFFFLNAFYLLRMVRPFRLGPCPSIWEKPADESSRFFKTYIHFFGV
jgi:hypothetical protein